MWLPCHVQDWLGFLAEGLSDEEAERIRVHGRKGMVLGGTTFVARLEAREGRSLQRRPRGRPQKIGTENVGTATNERETRMAASRPT